MKMSQELFKERAKLKHAQLDGAGREVNNPRPKFVKAIKKPETETERVRRMVQVVLSDQAASHGMESFDDANDFDIEDPFENDVMFSKYEMMEEEFLQEPPFVEGDDGDPGEGDDGSTSTPSPDTLPEEHSTPT